MPRKLNLTPHQAGAVRSALSALEFEQAQIHIDFDPMDVYVTETGWITVRGGAHGFEEHASLQDFEKAYGLAAPPRDLFALAHDMEYLFELLLEDAEQAQDLDSMRSWSRHRDRCRAAIAASLA